MNPERRNMYRNMAQDRLPYNGLISLTATEILILTDDLAHAETILSTAKQEAAESIGKTVDGTILDVVRALINEREKGRAEIWREGFYAGENKRLYEETICPYDEIEQGLPAADRQSG
jgi:hypothetical protein